MYYVCESSFTLPDRARPGFSHHELDYYAWTSGKDVPNHRLSLRKELRSGGFQVYRRFMERRAFALAGSGRFVSGTTNEDTGREEVVFTGSFEAALSFGRKETLRQHGFEPQDEPCQHRPGKKSFLCNIYEKEKV